MVDVDVEALRSQTAAAVAAVVRPDEDNADDNGGAAEAVPVHEGADSANRNSNSNAVSDSAAAATFDRELREFQEAVQSLERTISGARSEQDRALLDSIL